MSLGSVEPGRWTGIPVGLDRISRYPPPPSSLLSEADGTTSIVSVGAASLTPSESCSQRGGQGRGQGRGRPSADDDISDRLSTMKLSTYATTTTTATRREVAPKRSQSVNPAIPGASVTALLAPKLIARFQEAVILLDALYEILPRSYRRAESSQQFTLASPEDKFHNFLNRVAELLDSNPGGKTVTAVLVQDSPPKGIVYWIASNGRDTKKKIDVAGDFLASLIRGVAALPTGNTNNNADYAEKLDRLFTEVLGFNRTRLVIYMNLFSNKLEAILSSESTASRTPRQLVSDLSDISASENIAKPQEKENYDQYLKRTESLLNKLASCPGLEASVTSMCHGETTGEKTNWRGLKHLLGRLLQYRRAIAVLVSARDTWPELFADGFRVHGVVSPARETNPLKRKPTAGEIIGRMTSSKDEMARHRELAASVSRMTGANLDATILTRCKDGDKNPKPLMHAEVLLRDAFWRCQKNDGDSISAGGGGGDHRRDFYGRWACVGTSKGPCILCHFLFLDHESGAKLRRTHGNVYTAWRFPFPDVDATPGTAAFKTACHAMVDGVLEKLRKLVFTTLEKGRRTSGGDHDSNTNMTPFDRRRVVHLTPSSSDAGSSITMTGRGSTGSGGGDVGGTGRHPLSITSSFSSGSSAWVESTDAGSTENDLDDSEGETLDLTTTTQDEDQSGDDSSDGEEWHTCGEQDHGASPRSAALEMTDDEAGGAALT